MPRFGLSKVFGVGRGRKVFLNLQTGTTRGEAPDPWHHNHPARQLREKDQQIFRLKNKVKRQREELFQLKNRLATVEGPAAEEQAGPASPPASGGAAGALPDFVVIGAMRCGTTRFYGALTRHPHIKPAAVKELHFFDKADRFERGIGWYKEHFPPPETRDGHPTVTGEATPVYLFDPAVPERMARAVPDARLIALLRNPVDRAFSQYHRAVRNGAETRPFRETVEDELAWLAEKGSTDADNPHTQLVRGLYADQISRWRRFFPEERMLVIKSEDFFADVPGTLGKTQEFLGVPRREIEVPPEKTGRQSKYEYEPMDPDLRERLAEFFAPHNRRLYDLLGRDLGW